MPLTLPKFPNRWPLYLSLSGLLVVAIAIWYADWLATQLAEIEQRQLQLIEQAYLRLADVSALEDDVSMEQEVLAKMETLPAISVNAEGGINAFRNMGTEDTARVKRYLQQWIEDGRAPIRVFDEVLYFGESRLLRQLRLFPYVLLALILTFLGLGYYGLRQTLKAEQNRVWVGMAKETAHQLGTPISAIVGWVEHLRLMYADDEDIMEISDELHNDVGRLTMVADRFSKIGATPELRPVNIYAELDRIREYMQARSPRKVTFDFPDPHTSDLQVALNPTLFNWVLENLLRNALDAMDGKGEISAHVSTGDGQVFIDISDTGKGISAKNVRKVFNPGFTTKTRGWGLGLSLVRRIVHEYHGGRIIVSRSEPGAGTTFTISLPRL